MESDLKLFIDKLAGRNFGHPTHLLRLSPAERQQLSRIERDAVRFLAIDSPAALCRYLDVPFHEVEQCINQPRYNVLHVHKRNGKGKRLIEEPSMSLKKIQSMLNRGLGAVYGLIHPEQVHGFVRSVRGKNIGIVSNASVHAGSPFILNLDLKDFFHSVPASRVKQLLSSELFHFNEHIATALALLTTVNGRLPQGASTSPVLSNFACIPLDDTLTRFAESRGWSYSRYADDLTFSGSTAFTDVDLSAIRNLIENEGFRMNDRKTRRKSSSRKQKVTGLIVNKKVNVERKLIRKVRAMLHDARINGVESAAHRHFQRVADRGSTKYLNRLRGYVSFIGNVRGLEDPIYLRYRGQLRELFEEPLV